MTAKQPRLYKTEKKLQRRLRVCYPAGDGKIILRCELDWNRNIQPAEITDDGNTSTFELTADQPFLLFKPCLVRNGATTWAVGPNNLLLMGETDHRACFPFFRSAETGQFSELIERPSKILGRDHKLRVYLPPGYDENTLATYPVVYMQDGQNLFFPAEAFMGREWNVDDTSQTLRAMRAVEDTIIVGIYSANRMTEYTRPGYESYARSLVEEIIPAERHLLRGAQDRRHRSVWGSSLGGVVSFYAVWQYPEIFAAAVCMSSTFSHQDNLIERVLSEPNRDVGFYLDSGWPGDNYEVTMAMATALVARGWRYGHDLMHLSFPNAAHNENAWGIRLHIPMQFLNGSVARASRAVHPVLADQPDAVHD